MELKDLKQMTGAELSEKAKQLTQELFNLRFQLARAGSKIPCRFERPSG